MCVNSASASAPARTSAPRVNRPTATIVMPPRTLQKRPYVLAIACCKLSCETAATDAAIDWTSASIGKSKTTSHAVRYPVAAATTAIEPTVVGSFADAPDTKPGPKPRTIPLHRDGRTAVIGATLCPGSSDGSVAIDQGSFGRTAEFELAMRNEASFGALLLYLTHSSPPSRTQRNPRCDIPVSIICGERAAGRNRRQYSGAHKNEPPLRTLRGIWNPG